MHLLYLPSYYRKSTGYCFTFRILLIKNVILFVCLGAFVTLNCFLFLVKLILMCLLHVCDAFLTFLNKFYLVCTLLQQQPIHTTNSKHINQKVQCHSHLIQKKISFHILSILHFFLYSTLYYPHLMGFNDTQNMFGIDIETCCSQKIVLVCILDKLHVYMEVIWLFI